MLRTYLPANCFSAIFSPRQKLCLAANYGGTTQFIEIWIDQSDNLRAVLKAPHRGVVQANRPEKRLGRLDHVSVARCGDRRRAAGPRLLGPQAADVERR